MVAALVIGDNHPASEPNLAEKAPVAERPAPPVTSPHSGSMLPDHAISDLMPGDISTYRLEQLCGNSFLAGESDSSQPLDRLIASLPTSPVRSQREAALHQLSGRCEAVFQESGRDLRARHLADALRQAANGTAAPPSFAIKLLLDRGNVDAARQRLVEAILRHDPVDWVELSSDAPVFPSATDPEKSRRRFAALGLAACDRSIDCGPSSLLALQLCAFQGFCVGTVTDRVIPSLGYSVDDLAPELTQIRTRSAGNLSELADFLLGNFD